MQKQVIEMWMNLSIWGSCFIGEAYNSRQVVRLLNDISKFAHIKSQLGKQLFYMKSNFIKISTIFKCTRKIISGRGIGGKNITFITLISKSYSIYNQAYIHTYNSKLNYIQHRKVEQKYCRWLTYLGAFPCHQLYLNNFKNLLVIHKRRILWPICSLKLDLNPFFNKIWKICTFYFPIFIHFQSFLKNER